MPIFIIIVAIVGDYAFVLGRMAIVFYAIRQGASTATVLLLGGAEGLVYTVTAARLAGPFVARLGPRRMIRLTATAIGALFLLAPTIQSPIALIPLFALIGFPLSLFWPSIHAGLVERADPAILPRVQAHFNLAWTVGIGLAMATSGWLFEAGYARGMGPSLAIGIAAAGVGLLVCIPLPERRLGAEPPAPHESVSAAGSGVTMSREGRRIFATAGWLANFGSFAVYDAVRLVFPSLGPELGLPEGRIGLLIAVAFAAQGVTFVVTTIWKGWLYRRRWLYGACALHAGAMGICLVATGGGAFAAAFAMVGAALAMTYAASLFYSLGAADTAGHAGGRHEAMIGAARVLGPILGSGAVAISGYNRAPFLVYLFVITILILIYIKLFMKMSVQDRTAIATAVPAP